MPEEILDRAEALFRELTSRFEDLKPQVEVLRVLHRYRVVLSGEHGRMSHAA